MHIPSSSFESAANYLSTASSASNAALPVKLELYGLYKCLTVSVTPATKRPSIFDMTGRAKWDAWENASKTWGSRLGDAEQRYKEIAKELGWVEGEPGAGKQKGEENMDETGKSIVDNDEGQSTVRSGGGLGKSVSMIPIPAADAETQGTLQGLALSNNVAGIAALLQRQPDINLNALDQSGYAALHFAADRGYIEVVRFLTQKGADVNLKDADGYTATELARIAGHVDIVVMLEKGNE